MKRTSYLQYDDVINLGKRNLKVWGYGKNGKYVCRVEINAVGIAVYTGKKGQRCLANLTWEGLVQRLKQ